MHAYVTHDRNSGGFVTFLGGVIDNARAAVGVQVDALRTEVDDRVSAAGSKLVAMMIPLGTLIVAALLCGLAIAASLVALGVPLWVALWSEAVVVTAIGVGTARRAAR